MGLFSKSKPQDDQSGSVASAWSDGSVAVPNTGKISLQKGQSVRLTKEPGKTAQIVATNNWTNRSKDYDLKATVLLRNGTRIYVGAANRDEVLEILGGAVRHHGDVKSGAKEGEKVTITWHAEIAAVALSSYSALENGAGSFRKYGVSVGIDNSPEIVEISAQDTNADPNSYTLYFGRIDFNDDGSLTVKNQEQYSARGSEHRIDFVNGEVQMDVGPEGQPK